MVRCLLVCVVVLGMATAAAANSAVNAPRSDGQWITVIPEGEPPCECVITFECNEPSSTGASWHGDGASDLAGGYYRVEVGGGNGIIHLDRSCTVIGYCGDLGWGISQRAIAMDPGTGWVTLGSWNNPGVLYTVDPASCVLQQVSFLSDGSVAVAGGWYAGGFHGWITNEGVDRYFYTTMAGDGTHTMTGAAASMPWQIPAGGFTGAGVDIEEGTGRAIFVNQPAVLEAFTNADGGVLAPDGNCFMTGFSHGWGVAAAGEGSVAISDALAPYMVRYTGTPGCGTTANEPTTWGNVKTLYE